MGEKERERAGVHMDTMICFASIASRSSGPSVSRKIRTQQATKSRDRPHPHPAVQKTSVFRFCAHQFNNFFLKALSCVPSTGKSGWLPGWSNTSSPDGQGH